MKILCYGDSNTWGHDPIDGSQLTMPWPVVLRTLLPEYEIISEGECGRNSGFGAGIAEKNGFVEFKLLLEKGITADLLIVMLGTNDTLKMFDADPEESAEVIRRYIRTWKSHVSGGKVLVISPVHIREYSLTHPVFGELYTDRSVEGSHRFAELYSTVAAEERAFFMDAAKYARASDIDGIHLDPAEHEKLARAVAGKILEIEKN